VGECPSPAAGSPANAGAEHGALMDPATDAPAAGERTVALVRSGGVVVEQIVSGVLAGPVDYLEDVHEWAVVLAGRAVVERGADRFELGAGEWILLPAGIRHRLVETAPGTNWITVRWPPD